MNVLLIPEDFRKDQYLLRPLFERLFRQLNKPQARVAICNPPLLRGVTEALKSDRIQEVCARYPHADMFILCVDRDGQRGRKTRLDQIEAEFYGKKIFLAENAWEELETWTLAGLDLPREWSWNKIRNDVSVKENYFEPLAKQRGVSDGPGGGRRALGEESARRLASIIQKCPEGFGRLASRIEAHLK